MWKQIVGLSLLACTSLMGQNDWCYVPEGQTIYSEICCPDDCCPPTCPAPCSIFPVFVIDGQLGARRDSLSFTVQGPNGDPDRYLSQKYSKINSVVGAVNVWYQCSRQWYFRGFADYANITHGKERQQFQDETGETVLDYRQLAHSGDLWDIQGGFGWIFPFSPTGYTFALAGGYSQEWQSIKSNHAKLTTPDGDQGRVQGRRSTFNANWYGPWAGIDIAYRYDGLKIGGTFEYHWANFTARENQTAGGGCIDNCKTRNNLSAQARGLVGVLSATQLFCHNWRFGFVGKLQYWRTRSGNYRQSGTHLKLNKVKWNSGSVVANLGYRF